MEPRIKLYNTLSRQMVDFEPFNPPDVRLYVCGPTVYDNAHLGHARCYITWDVLFRFLTLMGYTVNYTRNITDVDDKILNRARENGEDPKALSERYTAKFHEVMDRLYVLRPTHEPLATEYVPQMVDFIQTLIDKDFAYVTPSGTVYYDTGHFTDYGHLCHQNLEDLQSGARVEVDPEKRSPLDFALWKPAPITEPLVWDAPWGSGRPGWHIECSTMSLQILGEQLDIHAGGMDLIFPHHQNEIAQSEAFTGRVPFVKYWMHNGFVVVSGEKMSKSLANFQTIETLLEAYDANTVRYFILTHHYRSPVDFTDEALEGAQNRIKKINLHLQQLLKKTATIEMEPLRTHVKSLVKEALGLPASERDRVDELLLNWVEAMASDLNTPQALSYLNILFADCLTGETGAVLNPDQEKALQVFLVMADGMGFDFLSALPGAQLSVIQDTLLSLYQRIQSRLYQEKGWAEKPPNPAWSSEALIDAILLERVNVRADKDWALSDWIRDELAALGVQIQDRKDQHATWTYEPVKTTASP